MVAAEKRIYSFVIVMLGVVLNGIVREFSARTTGTLTMSVGEWS